MKKQFIATVLFCTAIILSSAQTGFAYSTWNNDGAGGCNNCHVPSVLHAVAAHSTCSNCHLRTPAVGTVPPSNCIVCHPTSGPGKCLLVVLPSHPSSCLTCHVECGPPHGTTTTIIDDTTTTTTAVEETTTSTVIPAGCLTLAPNTVEVDSASIDDTDLDVSITITRDGINDETPFELSKLSFDYDKSCSNYVLFKGSEITAQGDQITILAHITVKASTPSTQCTLNVTDPTGVFDPPLNCAATFTITQKVPQAECSLVSVEPAIAALPLKAGIFPSLRRIVITGENSNWNRSSAISIEGIRNVFPARVQPTVIHAIVLIPSTLLGFQPGEKAVTVATGAETCQGAVNIN